MRHYADIHGMEFRQVVDKSYGRPPAWSKLYLTKECFDEGFDYVFWVDADAVIRRFDEDIRASVNEAADFYFAKERHPVLGTPSRWRLNTGVFVMRNCEASRQLIDAAIAREEYINHEWWDQAAISAALGFWSVFVKPDEHRPDAPTDLARHIGWLHLRWNTSPVYDPEPNANIHHFYGLRGPGKRAAMEMDAALDRFSGVSNVGLAARWAALKILEPSFRAGHPVAYVPECNHDMRFGIKALRKRPWRLWTSADWVKRKLLGVT